MIDLGTDGVGMIIPFDIFRETRVEFLSPEKLTNVKFCKWFELRSHIVSQSIMILQLSTVLLRITHSPGQSYFTNL